MPINWLTVGSLYGAAGVAFGAFGAHGLKSRGISDAKIGSWSTAAHYQVSKIGRFGGKKEQEGKKSRNAPLAVFPQTTEEPSQKWNISTTPSNPIKSKYR